MEQQMYKVQIDGEERSFPATELHICRLPGNIRKDTHMILFLYM